MRNAWVIIALVCCAPAAERAPILHVVDHAGVAPDELGLGTPAPATSASATPAIASAGAPPSPSAVAEAAAQCTPAATPPPAPSATHRIRSGPPITNYIPPETIMRPVRSRAACLRACYLAALAKSPDLHGRVVIHFVVEEDG